MPMKKKRSVSILAIVLTLIGVTIAYILPAPETRNEKALFYFVASVYVFIVLCCVVFPLTYRMGNKQVKKAMHAMDLEKPRRWIERVFYFEGIPSAVKIEVDDTYVLGKNEKYTTAPKVKVEKPEEAVV